jgi:hypothetical protein
MPTPQQAQWLAKLGVKGAAGAPPTRGGPTGGQAAAASAPPPAQIPVPQVAGDSKDAAVKALSPLDTIKASPTQKGMFTIVLNGQPTPVSEAQVSEARAKTRDAMKRNLVAVKIKAEGAMTRYSEQKKVDADQWAVSAAVTALKKVTSLGKFADPGPNLTKEVDAARAALAAASSALDGNAFAKAAAAFADAEAAAAKAEQMAIAYCEGMIDGAGSSITVLERTRDVSAITVAVLATIATAGAASGAIGATTTVAGVQVGTVAAANVVATGASIAGSVGMAASQMALGNKVDWGAVAIDAAIQLLLAKFGGAASKGISASVAKQLATRMAAKRIVELGIEKLVQGIILQEASVTLHTVAESVYAELRGKDLTWGQFFKTLLERLTDPRGLAVAAVVAALTTGAEAKYGGGLVTAGGGKDGAGGKPPPGGGGNGGAGGGGKPPSDKLFPDLTDAEVGGAVDTAKHGDMQRIEPIEHVTDAEIERAVDNAQAGTPVELPGQDPKNPNRGLVGVEIRENELAPIAHHDNTTLRGVEGVPPGDDLQVRRHSANPKAPAGSYSHDNPTTQVNTVDPATPMQTKMFRLPDGTYKRFADMTEAEKAATHME